MVKSPFSLSRSLSCTNGAEGTAGKRSREVTMHRSRQRTLADFVINSSGTQLTHLIMRLAWPGFSVGTHPTSATRVAQTVLRKLEETSCLIGLLIGWRNAALSQIQDRTRITLMFHTNTPRPSEVYPQRRWYS